MPLELDQVAAEARPIFDRIQPRLVSTDPTRLLQSKPSQAVEATIDSHELFEIAFFHCAASELLSNANRFIEPLTRDHSSKARN